MNTETGGFTLPGEAGYDELTLNLARRWGADSIRDSDGTRLSEKIANSGYDIYSTICVIRDHNEWANQNRDKLQQTFLYSFPQMATKTNLSIRLLDGYSEEQFAINDTAASLRYWQVFDRSAECELPREDWDYHNGVVTLRSATPFHRYSVNFLAYRIWEEISMYNHITNHWDKEHLLQIDPRCPEVRQYLLGWMEDWCREHTHTSIVRFTSLFYNFVWIWGSDSRNRYLFSDCSSYDFTVSSLALDEFMKEYHYSLTAEDFINQGKRHVTHMPANQKKRDWMDFIHRFVTGFAKQLVDIVHRYGKKAYFFYDDSWIGAEPYGPYFPDMGFDGVIKCVFSGYEARLCAGVRGVKVHELRLHPYLFPVGLGGAPTFMEGGAPAHDAREYWVHVRRALLREPIDRIGLGGYLHLVETFPDFCSYIEKLAEEFRTIRNLHALGRPMSLGLRIGVLTSWGKLRSWTLSGHFHETHMHLLIHVYESLSGLPVDVEFLNFDDIRQGVPNGLDVIVNAGAAGSAWSGGDYWKDDLVVSSLTEWVYKGGAFIGIGEPSAVGGYDTYFRMADVLGVDRDTGNRVCHGKWPYISAPLSEIVWSDQIPQSLAGLYPTGPDTKVLAAACDSTAAITCHAFGEGKGIYLSAYTHSNEHAFKLLKLLLFAAGRPTSPDCITDNPDVECAVFPGSKAMVLVNNGDKDQECIVKTTTKTFKFTIDAYEMKVIKNFDE